MSTRRPRLLLLIVGPGTAATIQEVLARVPARVIQDFEVEAVVFGAQAADWALPFPVADLPRAEPDGYGASQKLGFEYAIARGFDAVALLHAGGYYDPQALPALLAPLTIGQADAVYGSRMIAGAGPKTAMPLYKLAANRALTRLQNRLVRGRLSEFHSGYRAYSTAALHRIPFDFNSSSFPFDTEITVQLLLSGQRIAEVPIPGYHGPELSVFKGLRHALEVLIVCAKARAQDLSLFFDRKFDCQPSTVSNVHYKPRLGFASTHTLALDAIPAGSRVLDIGCAGGYFGRLLRERGCSTTGVDRLPLDEGNALDAFHLHDLNRLPLPVDVAQFDYVVMLDVLEHLQSPETFVDGFRLAASPNPRLKLVISTPNVAFIVVRLMLLFGQFNYGKRGILDLTHTRLFTFRTFRRLLEQSGYEIVRMQGVPAPFPLALGDSRMARGLLAFQKFLIGISRSLFAFQIFAVVRPRPTPAYLVSRRG